MIRGLVSRTASHKFKDLRFRPKGLDDLPLISNPLDVIP